MSNSYIKTPESISFNSIEQNGYSLSSSQYMDLVIANQNFLHVRDFLSRPLKRSDLGIEIGSINYIGKSPYYFLRTKALQPHSFLPEITSESALPILPKAFHKANLKEDDLLISKDSNIGEIVILDKDYPNHMISGALYKLPVTKQKYYLLAFIKHQIFREQLGFMVAKGATIRHAKMIFLDCKIPMPNKNADETIKFIELLTQSIINKEKLIKQRHQTILETIETELMANQKPNKFKFEHPCINEVLEHNRMDAIFYSEKHKSLMFSVINYKYGFLALDKQGLELKPGPSLEIKILGTRINSEIPLPGFYRLITPKQILNYGTLKNYEYIGTPREIAKINYGDILFGESGTGRTMVYLDRDKNTINNAHAHVLRPIVDLCSLEKAITIRSIMQYYKEIGITDCLTVGGAGGHLSPSYFNRVYIPNFPDNKQKEIAKLYHNADIAYNTSKCTMDNFLVTDDDYNDKSGIYELDKTAKRLKAKLNQAIDDIVNDKQVDISFDLEKK